MKRATESPVKTKKIALSSVRLNSPKNKYSCSSLQSGIIICAEMNVIYETILRRFAFFTFSVFEM